MPLYFINLDSKTYEIIFNQDRGMAEGVREKFGMNVIESESLPDETYTEDRFMLLNLEIPMQLDELLSQLEDRVKRLQKKRKYKSVVFYWISKASFHFDLKGVKVTEQTQLAKEPGKVVLGFFSISDDGLIDKVRTTIDDAKENLRLKE